MIASPPCCAPFPPEAPSARVKALIGDAIRERVARSDLAPERDSTAFRAAVLLLAALRVGQNVDRLARCTGYEREFVARCARRLCDNGVWRAGETVCTWGAAVERDPAFWSDVQVAEGRLCRQVGDDGRIQWAPSGVWRKSYDFVERAEPATVSVRYSPAVAPEPDPGSALGALREPVRAPSRPSAPAPMRSLYPQGGTPDPRSHSRPDLAAAAPESRSPRPEPLLAFTSQFPDAVWLG